MTVQQIIKPSEIESRLKEIWNEIGKNEKMMRACLFNLIVYTKVSERCDYLRTIVQHVIEKFPSRVIFITADRDSKESYLKTAVSVVTAGEAETQIACDNIDIAVAGEDSQKVPFVLLPHIIPDLPVYLLWEEDPCIENSLYAHLEKLTSRTIFDSESSKDMLSFAKTIIEYEQKKHHNIADMNWARTESWRDLIAATFYSANRLEKLRTAQEVEITYNTISSQFFNHIKIQSIYLQAWLASRLGWVFSSEKEDQIEYKTDNQPLTVKFTSDSRENVKPGAIVSVKITDRNQQVFHLFRNPDDSSHITVEVSSQERCEVPHHFVLAKSTYGQSLVKEITYNSTSEHFLSALTHILKNGQNA